MTAHTLFLTAASLFSAETQDVTPVTAPGSGSRSQDVASPTRNVVDVYQLVDKVPVSDPSSTITSK